MVLHHVSLQGNRLTSPASPIYSYEAQHSGQHMKWNHFAVSNPLEIDHPSPASFRHSADAITKSSKGHSTVRSGQLLQGDGEHGKTNEFHEPEPIAVLHLL